MRRRGFLAMIAGAVLDPERALWVPGRRVISIPKPVVVERIPFYDELNRVTLEALRAYRALDIDGGARIVEPFTYA